MKNNRFAYSKLLILFPCIFLASCGGTVNPDDISTMTQTLPSGDDPISTYTESHPGDPDDPTPSQPDREEDVDYVQVEKDQSAHVLVLQAYSRSASAIQVVGRIITFEGDTFDKLEPYFPTIPDYVDTATGKTWEQKFEKYDADGKEYNVWDESELEITITAARNVKHS